VSTEDQINSIISAALQTASDKASAAQSFSQEALQAIDSAGFTLSNPPIFSSSTKVPLFQGDLTADPGSTFLSNLGADAAALTAQLSNIFTGFLDTYFPRAAPALQSAEAWLERVLNVGGTGIKPEIEDQIWQRARTRELREADRTIDAARTEFAARGFTLPPGALAGRIMEAQGAASDRASAISRDIAIKQAEMELETVKFAVQQTLQLRVSSIQAALEYWRGYLLPEDIAAKKAMAQADIKIKFYNTALEYFNAQIRLYGYQVQEGSNFFDAANKAYMAQAQAKVGLGQAKATAATAAAKAAGDIGSAAMAAVNALSQNSFSESKQS
jgi:hypothetical protein